MRSYNHKDVRRHEVKDKRLNNEHNKGYVGCKYNYQATLARMNYECLYTQGLKG